MYFQHNDKTQITLSSYIYVILYKKQLLSNVTKLLNDLSIKFVISHGNLIEFERGTPIYHDDDVDIRFDVSDIPKWMDFCSKNECILNNYNLVFDGRFKKFEYQVYNGIQCRLIKFHNEDCIKEYSTMDIHCDIVASHVTIDFWMDYLIDFSNLRTVSYLGVRTSAPSKEDTYSVLSTQYGSKYLIPDRKIKFEESSE